MARHRSFSSEFKRQISREFEGRAGMHELARRYSLSRNLIRLWVRKYEAGEFTDELAEAVRVAEYERKIAELERKVGQLTTEGRSAQKRGATGTPRQRRELLNRERPRALSLTQGCRLMKLARSTYYCRSRGPTATKNAVEKRIALLCAKFPRYGYRRIPAQLQIEGMDVNHKAVARVMREKGLHVRPLRRFVRTTDSEHDSPIFPNLARGFTPTTADQLWVADITYIAIGRSFV
jgi:transposase-like protein